MEALNKRVKVCLVLFGISLGIAVLSFAGAVLLAYSKAYAAGIVLGAVAIIGFYSAPIYYNNAALAKASVKIISALDEGSESLDELSEKTGIRSDVCEKLFNKAVLRGFITDFQISNRKILKK
ncbi:MAG: hypothetical protein IJW38_01845 [Clostridia bacterium]|nr:hypothetical protein [Clostridia bacterium]